MTFFRLFVAVDDIDIQIMGKRGMLSSSADNK